jgi:hypothetical protein
MRCEGRLRRSKAPRRASMLELEKLGTEAASAVGASCSAASQQNVRAAQVAGAAEWICHLDIVNLKQSVRRAPPFKNAGRRRCHDFDPSRAAGPNLAGSCPPFACDLRAEASPRMETGKPPDGSTTRPGLSVQPAGHRLMVPAKRLTQLLSEPAAQTRSEFATHDK